MCRVRVYVVGAAATAHTYGFTGADDGAAATAHTYGFTGADDGGGDAAVH
jgi:hypothetical protein